MSRSSIVGALFSFVWLAALPQFVFAHAFLDHAEPKVGAEVKAAPTEVKVWMSEEVEPAFSTLQVFDASGNQIDQKDAHLDKKDKKLLIVSVPKLADGEYKIVWKVVAADTHHTHGDFKFKVKAKG